MLGEPLALLQPQLAPSPAGEEELGAAAAPRPFSLLWTSLQRGTALARRRGHPRPRGGGRKPGEGEEKHPKPSWLPVLRGLLEKLSTNSPLTTLPCAQGAEGSPQAPLAGARSPTRCPRPCPAPEENTPDHQKESQQPLGIFLFVCCISYIIQFHILIGSASIEQLTLKSFNTSETAMVI